MDHLSQSPSSDARSWSHPDSLPLGCDQVEDYLDRVFAPLVETLPYAVRSERRAEMRSHLEASIAARIELGWPAAVAVDSALRECGEPRRIAEAWLRSWPDAGCVAPGKLAPFLLKTYGLATAVAFLLVFTTGDRINYSFGWPIHALVVFGVPLLTGLWVGRRVARRPARTAALATLWVLPATCVGYTLWSIVMPFDDKVHAATLFTMFHTVGWLIAGTAGATLGGWLRKGLRSLRAAVR